MRYGSRHRWAAPDGQLDHGCVGRSPGRADYRRHPSPLAMTRQPFGRRRLRLRQDDEHGRLPRPYDRVHTQAVRPASLPSLAQALGRRAHLWLDEATAAPNVRLEAPPGRVRNHDPW